MESTTAGTLLRRSRNAGCHRQPKRRFRFCDLHPSYAFDMGSQPKYKEESLDTKRKTRVLNKAVGHRAGQRQIRAGAGLQGGFSS